jgi:hypothetical protein
MILKATSFLKGHKRNMDMTFSITRREGCWSRYSQLIDYVKTMLNSFQS